MTYDLVITNIKRVTFFWDTVYIHQNNAL